jgi:8-oxo-dGTP pyrophosphatase MutT (NUDIX family)
MVRRGGDQRIPRPADVHPGPPAPWSTLDEAARQVTLAQLRERLATHTPFETVIEPFPIRRPAGVLVPVYEGLDGELRVILTRRPWEMRSHSGEVSFPGGGQDPEDIDIEATALREAWEEIGLPAHHVEIIGQLDPLATMSSGAHISPFVGVVHGVPELVPAPREVAAILHVPFGELLDDEVFHEELWAPITGMDPFPAFDGRRPMYFFDLIGDTVWGATARMLVQLLRIATGTDR